MSVLSLVFTLRDPGIGEIAVLFSDEKDQFPVPGLPSVLKPAVRGLSGIRRGV